MYTKIYVSHVNREENSSCCLGKCNQRSDFLLVIKVICKSRSTPEICLTPPVNLLGAWQHACPVEDRSTALWTAQQTRWIECSLHQAGRVDSGHISLGWRSGKSLKPSGHLMSSGWKWTLSNSSGSRAVRESFLGQPWCPYIYHLLFQHPYWWPHTPSWVSHPKPT